MKKVLLIIAICFSGQLSFAQFNTTLVVSPSPPGSLLSWGVKDLTYIINGGTGVIRQAVIKATLKTADGTIAGTTNLAKAKIITAGATTLIFYAADVIPLQAMIFNGKFKTSLDKTGKLPAGSYQLCVQLVTPGNYAPVSEERCRNFNLAAYQLAIPIMPFNEQELKPLQAQTAITFRWAPVSPPPPFTVTYRILVFEVLEKQTPMQALRSNMPLLNKDVRGTTQYIWQPQGILSLIRSDSTLKGTNSKTFIWTLQCLDNIGQPFGDGNINGDGISEPIIFYVGKEAGVLKEKKTKN